MDGCLFFFLSFFLFVFHHFDHQFLGLGGTSLINANVFLEADAGTLSLDVWPPEIRDNPEALTECKFVSEYPSDCQHLMMDMIPAPSSSWFSFAHIF